MKFSEKLKDAKLMKKLAIIGAILFGIGVIGMALTIAVAGQRINETVSEDFTATGDVSSIYLELYSQNIEIRVEERDDVFVECNSVPKEYLPKISESNGELKIIQKSKVRIGFDLSFITFLRDGFQKSEIIVTIPQKIYDKIEINSSLGDTKVTNIHTDELIVETGMGIANITATADNVEIEAGMGVVNFTSEKENGKKLIVSGGMGDVTIKNADFAQYSLDLSMGNLDINGITGTGKINADMGNITAKVAKWTGDMELNASMGNIEVTLPKGSGAVIEAEADLGSVDVNLGGLDSKNFSGTASFNGDGMHKIDIDASMGDVNISD